MVGQQSPVKPKQAHTLASLSPHDSHFPYCPRAIALAATQHVGSGHVTARGDKEKRDEARNVPVHRMVAFCEVSCLFELL
jgi:hypothetical protein